MLIFERALMLVNAIVIFTAAATNAKDVLIGCGLVATFGAVIEVRAVRKPRK